MFKTKYDSVLSTETILDYLDILIGKIFKLLPIWEEHKEAFAYNHKKLMSELMSAENIVLHCGLYIELANSLESLGELETHSEMRSRIFEAIDTVKKLKEKVRGWDFGQIDK